MRGAPLVASVLLLVLLAISQAVGAPAIPRAALAYRSALVREAQFAFGLLAPVPMLAAQIHQESGWDERVCSAYACGLAQFTPSTADWISGVYKGLGPAAPTDPAWALRAMVTYDRRLHDSARPYETECDRWRFGLSDYNGGAGRRMARQRLSPRPGSWAATAVINPGIAPANQRQNEDYPRRIVDVLQELYSGWTGALICAKEGAHV